MVDIIIFAVIAGLLFWKFKDILGKEDANTPVSSGLQKVKDITPNAKEQASIIGFLDSSKKEAKEQKKLEIEEQIKRNIALLAPEFEPEYRTLASTFQSEIFDVKGFYNGVENLFAELIKAQNTKNYNEVETFLAPDFFKSFKSLIENQPLNQRTELVQIEKIEIVSIKTLNEINVIKVSVLSKQIKFVKENETVVSGSISIPSKFSDVLIIKRNFKNQSGNWLLHEIE